VFFIKKHKKLSSLLSSIERTIILSTENIHFACRQLTIHYHQPDSIPHESLILSPLPFKFYNNHNSTQEGQILI